MAKHALRIETHPTEQKESWAGSTSRSSLPQDPTWTIRQDDDGWFWTCADGASISESERFSSTNACFEDAVRHGFADDEPGCHPCWWGVEGNLLESRGLDRLARRYRREAGP